MASSAELQFILRMRDEASSVLKQFTSSATGAGAGAKNLHENSEKAGLSIAGIIGHAKEAAEAIAGLWATSEIGKSAVENFAEFEVSLLRVGYKAKLAGAELEQFKSQFIEMTEKVGTANPNMMLKYAEAAGQLGIRGTPNLLMFSQTMAKLAEVTDIAGEQAAIMLGRILVVTGEGASGVKGLSNSLVALSENTKASAQDILYQTSLLAQSTAQFHFSTAALAGMGAGFKQLNVDAHLVGTTIAMTLTQARDAALDMTAGGKDLATVMGMSTQEILKLIDTRPDQFIIRFVKSLHDLTEAGQSTTGILSELHLQGAHYEKVLGTAAKSVDSLANAIQLSINAASTDILETRHKAFAETVMGGLHKVSAAYSLFAISIGEKLAPALNLVTNNLAALIDKAADALNAMGPLAGGIAAFAIVALPALVGIAAAWGLIVLAVTPVIAVFTTAFGWLRLLATGALALGRAFLFIANLGEIFTALGAGITTVVGFVVTAVGGVALAISAAVALVALGIYEIYKHWAAVKAFFGQSWSDIGTQIVDTLTRAFTSAMATAKSLWTEFWSWFKTGSSKQSPDLSEAAQTGAESLREHTKANALSGTNEVKQGHEVPEGRPDTGQANIKTFLTEPQKKAIESLDAFSAKDAKITEQEEALKILREKSARLSPDVYNSNKAGLTDGEGQGRSKVDLDRMQGLLDLEKARLNMVQFRVTEMGLEGAAALALTQDAKNKLQIDTEIRLMAEKRGVLTVEEEKSIRAATAAMQAQKAAASLGDERKTLKDQLEMAQAITQSEKDELSIKQQMNAYEKAHGSLEENVRSELEAQLGLIKMIEGAKAQMDTLNPQAKGIRDYTEQLDTLKDRLQQGMISQREFNRERTKLDNDTRAARDPIGAIVQSQKEELDQLAIGGEYRNADVKSMQKLLELSKQGIQPTQQMTEAMQEYNRALQDAAKAKTSGFDGWADQVGTLKDNLMGLEKDFASGLGGAISSALDGQKGSFHKFAASFGAKMVETGVNQLLKQGMEASGLLGRGEKAALEKAKQASASLGSEAAKQASDTADMAKQMSVATANITAATVNIDGTSLGSLKAPENPASGVAVPAPAGVSPSAFAAANNGTGLKTLSPIPQLAASPANGLSSTSFGAGKTMAAMSGVDMGEDYTKQDPTAIRAALMSHYQEKFGLDKNQAAGIVGNFGHESGGFKQYHEAGQAAERGGVGLAQYTNSGGYNRRAAFEDYAKQNGQNPRSLGASVAFSDHELEGRYSKSITNLKKTSTPEEAMRSFERDYEGAGVKGFSSRSRQAHEALRASETRGGTAKEGANDNGAAVATARKHQEEVLKMQQQGSAQQVQQAQVHNQQVQAVTRQGGLQNLQVVRQSNQQQVASTQQMATAAQGNAQRFGALSNDVKQAGDEAQQAGPKFQQVGQSAQTAGSSSANSSQGLGGLASGIQGLTGPLNQVVPGLGTAASALMSFVSQLGSMGGGGMGGGGLLSGIMGIFGGMHSGGVVGSAGMYSTTHTVSPAIFNHAPRFHSGLKDDEYPAILQRGERVLTANDNSRTQRLISNMADNMGQMQHTSAKAAQAPAANGRHTTQNMNITVNTPNADSFRKSKSQVMADMGTHMQRASGHS